MIDDAVVDDESDLTEMERKIKEGLEKIKKLDEILVQKIAVEKHVCLIYNSKMSNAIISSGKLCPSPCPSVDLSSC